MTCPTRFLTGLIATLVASSAVTGQSTTDPLAAEADRLIKAIWDAHLRTCGSSAFETLDGRVVLELEKPGFHLAPTKLQEPARVNGYQFQTTAIASAQRWRWAPLTGAGKLKWSPWQEGQTLTVRFDQTGGERGQTTVHDAVLQFDLLRRHGRWQANHPLSPLNSDFRPFDPTAISQTAQIPSCERLVGKSSSGSN